ncbi:MAG: DMT family transporter [Deltaproteobacteria bacterium]|nr:DMT family transporter [Deltaproteobacteria bacterium]
MNSPVIKETLDLKAVAILTGLCMLWGFNAVTIKISNAGIAPVFSAGIRSVIAVIALVIWMRAKKVPLFPSNLWDGVVVGLLFGAEFACLYASLLYTTASSAWILLYATPFFHAVGAHFFLKDDRLTVYKTTGLALAFIGIIVLLSKHLGLPSWVGLVGDLLAFAAAALWALTTIYIKRRLVGSVSFHNTLFYQTLFSIPILFLISVLIKETPIDHLDGAIVLSIVFQGIIVAFISYLLWFYLVHEYPVSRLSAFTFLTPVFATISCVVFLHEPLTWKLSVSLILVSLGIYVVNMKPLRPAG